MLSQIFYEFMPKLAAYTLLEAVMVNAFDNSRNFHEAKYNSEISGNEKTLKDPVDKIYESITNYCRFPFFVSGLSLMSLGIIKVFDSISAQDPSSFKEAIVYFGFGYGLFGTSSSIYVKASDSKLLDKSSFWQNAYDKVLEAYRQREKQINSL